MTVSVNCGGINQNVAFKGSHKRTDEGNSYYHTTAGTTAGAVLAVPTFASFFFGGKLMKTYAEFLKNYTPKEAGSDGVKALEQIGHVYYGKHGKIMAFVAGGLTLGCGMLVDRMRNNKAKDLADLRAKVGTKNALRMSDGAAVSKNGKVYYDSNIGSKYGTLLGAGCGVVAAGSNFLRDKEIAKNLNMPFPHPILKAVSSIVLFALGGWIMGKITDHNTNKAAERKA